MVYPLLTKHTFSGLTTASLKVWTKKSELHESLHILFPEKKSFWAMHHPIFLFGEKTLFSQNPPINCLEKKLVLSQMLPIFLFARVFPFLQPPSLKVWTIKVVLGHAPSHFLIWRRNPVFTNPPINCLEKKSAFYQSICFFHEKNVTADVLPPTY